MSDKIVAFLVVAILGICEGSKLPKCVGADDPDIVNPATECPAPDFTGDQNPDKYQGDIDGMNPKSTDEEANRNAVRAFEDKWPKSGDGNVYIPYDFDFTMRQRGRQAVQQAIRDFNDFTCIRFIPRGSQRDYVHITRGQGCSSALGRTGGKQFLSLGGGCETKGTAIHEMIHALGFLHEQARPDRDSFIDVLWRNILPGRESQFEKGSFAEFTTLGLSYDYKSLMHYNNIAFSKNGRPTMVSKDPSVTQLGQRLGFTRLDIQKVNALYTCSQGPATPPTTRRTTPFRTTRRIITTRRTTQRPPIIITGTPRSTTRFTNPPPTAPPAPGPGVCQDKSGTAECLRVIRQRPEMCNNVKSGPTLCRKSCGFC